MRLPLLSKSRPPRLQWTIPYGSIHVYWIFIGYVAAPKRLSICYDWRPQGDSNPCYRRERAMSWAAEEITGVCAACTDQGGGSSASEPISWSDWPGTRSRLWP